MQRFIQRAVGAFRRHALRDQSARLRRVFDGCALLLMLGLAACLTDVAAADELGPVTSGEFRVRVPAGTAVINVESSGLSVSIQDGDALVVIGADTEHEIRVPESVITANIEYHAPDASASIRIRLEPDNGPIGGTDFTPASNSQIRFDRGSPSFATGILPDGSGCLTGGSLDDYTIRLFDVSGNELRRYRVDDPTVDLAVAPDGRTFAAALLNGRVLVYDIADESILFSENLPKAATTVDFAPDGSRLLTGCYDGVVRTFDLATGNMVQELQAHDGAVRATRSPDGRRVATAGFDRLLKLWDAETGRLLWERKHPEGIWSVQFSPDGKHVATGTGGELTSWPGAMHVRPGDDNRIRIFDAASGQLESELIGHDHVVKDLAFTPEGRELVSVSFDGSLRRWSLDGRLVKRFDGRTWFLSVSISPDGTYAVVGGGASNQGDGWVEEPAEFAQLLR